MYIVVCNLRPDNVARYRDVVGSACLYAQCFPQVQKERGGRYNFSMRSKQIKHSNDHIKGNQVRKGGEGVPWYPPLGETLMPYVAQATFRFHADCLMLLRCCNSSSGKQVASFEGVGERV